MRYTLLVLAVLLAAARAALAGDPGPQDIVSQKEVEDLRRQIEREQSSEAEVFGEYHNRSGDLNSHLQWGRYGARLNFHWGDAQVFVRASRTNYSTMDSVLTAAGTNATLGVGGKLSSVVDGRLELGLTHFSTRTNTVNGLAALTYKPSEKGQVSLTGARTNVEESLLATAGIRPVLGPFAGGLVGAVMENRVTLAANYRLPAHFDLFGEAGLGNRQGDNVPSDSFRRAGGGVGFNAVAREETQPLSLFRLSASVFYFGFDDNRFGFGGASLLDAHYLRVPLDALGSDGLPTAPEGSVAGVGGFFSPANFVSGVGRLEARGHASPSVDYKISGFLGLQNYTGSSSRAVEGATGDLTFHMGHSVSLPLALSWDNVGPYHQFTASARLVARF